MTAFSTETQGENQDTRLIPLSALQHYAFCPRQCALIHNEQAWAENYLTAQGRALHERVDSGEPETRKGVRFERTVHVSAEKLGISGVLDLVEVETKTGRLKPVEYKRGKPKPDPMDEIQLCAQGLCLEEMTGQTVSEGALWYMQTVHEHLNSGQTPTPDYSKRCKACSLVEICQPELLGKRDRSVGYVEGLFEEDKFNGV